MIVSNVLMSEPATAEYAEINLLLYFLHVTVTVAPCIQESAATDRPAQCSGSAHAKYSIANPMLIKTFLLLS